MPLTEAQKFAEAIRASFKMSMADIDSNTGSNEPPKTVSRSITRKSIGSGERKGKGKNEGADAPVTKPVKGILKRTTSKPKLPALPPMPDIGKLTMNLNALDIESDGSSKPSELDSLSPLSAGSAAMSTTSLTVYSKGTNAATEGEEAEDEDMDEGVVVQLLNPPQSIKFEAGVKPRVFEVQRGTLTHQGKKVYLANDASSGTVKDQILVHDGVVKDEGNEKEAGTLRDGFVLVKRARKLSIQKAVKQWMHEVA
ncbi:hypothetical protein BJ165DRAFT_1595620 [Panaeolus papilionaceus]|nr:hypothetical protein BJ165DRAFT_1595620 [Panaeolus papilionaceus]